MASNVEWYVDARWAGLNILEAVALLGFLKKISLVFTENGPIK